MTSVNPEDILKSTAEVTHVSRHFIRHGGNRPLFTRARAVALLALRRAGYGWRRCGHALNRAPASLVGLARSYEHDEHVQTDVRRVSEIHSLQNGAPNAATPAARRIP